MSKPSSTDPRCLPPADIDRMSPEELRRLVRGLKARVTELERRETPGFPGDGEQRFRNMFQDLPLIVWVHDREGRLDSVSHGSCEFFGVGEDEMSGDRWLAFVHPDDRDAYAGELAGCVGKRRDFHGEVRMRRVDGEWRWLETWGRPLQSDAGEFRGFVGVSADITELTRARLALRTSSRNLHKLSRAIEKSPASVMITGTSAEIEYVNPAFLEVTGYQLEEVLGRNARILKSGVHTPDFYRGLHETIASGRAWHSEICNRKKSGELYWELIVIAPIEDENGGISHYVSIAEDITERQRALAELRDREERLSSILHAAVDAIITIDNQGTILSVNPATERIFGYGRDELIGENVKMLMPSPYHEEHDGYLARHRRTGENHIIGIGREVSGKRKDGSVFPADLSVNKVDGADVYTGIIRDVTGRKEAEDAQTSLGRLVEESLGEIFVVDAETLKFLQVNRGGRVNVGYTMEELREMSPLDLVSRGDPERLNSLLEILRSGAKSKIDLEDKLQRKDGTCYNVEISAQMTTYRGRPCFVAHILDVTRRHELEQEVVRAAEEEQQRIANDLHDDLGSLLTGIKLRAESLVRLLAESPGDSEAVAAGEEVVAMIQNAITTTRSIARGLRPVGSHPEDLMITLRRLIESVNTTTDVSCRLHCPVSILVHDQIVSHHLFRITQEAVNNAVKHSNGEAILISLTRSGDTIELEVCDEGRGIDHAEELGSGLGLHIMKYRAAAIGGTFRISRRKNRAGTRVFCSVRDAAP
ncbi:PAS domain S-box protein [Luteolibacter marinus]|uniref:PAS domain S-box protein n=1 Tax=Luteolibacter marinus TaxID=2776705 RepID=UPI001865CFC1|nr:PAS domain S-box protein [Luteolibacter marinus]